MNIYDDTTRYMPLGGDATVAYGHKDKIKITSKPIRFASTRRIPFQWYLLCRTVNNKQNRFYHYPPRFGYKSSGHLINDKVVLTSTYKNLLPK